MELVRHLTERGWSARDVARETGIPYITVLRWRRGETAAFGPAAASGPAPTREPWHPPHAPSYAYLLGLYLGDGHIQVQNRSALLRIFLDGIYPGIVEDCRTAIVLMRLRGPAHVYFVRGSRVNIVQSSWVRWPEAFPQHGPGRKHERPIVLEDWQQVIVDEHPDELVRGLIHSDGCRTVNRFKTKLPSGRVAEYAYPRYFFSNLSPDIRNLFCEACDRLGVRTTQSNPRNISVSHRRSVAILEDLVGPKG